MVKTIYWIQHTKIIEAGKNNDKDGKALFKLMNSATYGKTMKNLKKENRCKTSKQQKTLFNMYMKTKLYVAQNIWQ